MAIVRPRITAALLFTLATTAFAGEFTYTIPEGWRDLKKAARDGRLADSGLPAAIQRDVLDDRFVAYAVDEDSIGASGAGALFNAVEVPSAGVLSLEQVQNVSRDLVRQLQANGRSVQAGVTRTDQWGDVLVGVVTVDVHAQEGRRRFLQYLVPGKSSGALLTYTAPVASFDSYERAFDASARATKGAYAAAKWPSNKIFIVVAFLFPLIGGVVIVKTLARRSSTSFGGDVLEPPKAQPAEAEAPRKPIASKYVWQCEACGKPVPMRLEQCRCGGRKPPGD